MRHLSRRVFRTGTNDERGGGAFDFRGMVYMLPMSALLWFGIVEAGLTYFRR
jgi:hypothetical protein